MNNRANGLVTTSVQEVLGGSICVVLETVTDETRSGSGGVTTFFTITFFGCDTSFFITVDVDAVVVLVLLTVVSVGTAICSELVADVLVAATVVVARVVVPSTSPPPPPVEPKTTTGTAALRG